MIDMIHKYVVPAALAVLPAEMGSTRARAMLLAIGLQESCFLSRHQAGGPARGFWQFEQHGGVAGVLQHARTHDHLVLALRRLRYAAIAEDPRRLHEVIEHNDVVACVFARLLLWTVPHQLPGGHEHDLGWADYVNAWRPGKPHPETWNAFFDEAWGRVSAEGRI